MSVWTRTSVSNIVRCFQYETPPLASPAPTPPPLPLHPDLRPEQKLASQLCPLQKVPTAWVSLHKQNIWNAQPVDHLLPLPASQHSVWARIIRHGQIVKDGYKHDWCVGWYGLGQVESKYLARDHGQFKAAVEQTWWWGWAGCTGMEACLPVNRLGHRKCLYGWKWAGHVQWKGERSS